ncbi:branched-chain amino acid ABC transporter permease [Rhodovulum viride]|uniref:Branched-chain amino acid ABC transporter permease n=1 Tax=Rhodovulum viride TaxID=1231134 RepID=A0ABX9DKS0_9RHOB|nr:branched-chain amino acid ABC transporter permease [Rhodovulum viride]RAP43002.1 branched-chain amino acid ABC transporter permease [Rhodovulum viride]
MRRERLLNALILLALLAVPLAAQALDEPFLVTLATKAAILALAGVGLNLALGLGGMVSLGHAAFFGIGGYAMAVLAAPVQAYEPLISWPMDLPGTKSMPAIWLAAMAAGALAALVIGALSLRTGGVYFIMITLAFAQMLYYFAVSWPAYGGEDGISIYVRNGFPGLDTLDPLQFFGLCLGALLLALAAMHLIARSRFGLALDGARQNPERVAALGLRPARLKLIAFVLSGAVTALAGALFADLNRFVSPSMLHWQTSGEIMVFVILGGAGRLFGPVAGAAIFVLLEHLLGGVSEYWKLFLGLALLGIVLFARGGLIGALAGRAVAHD